MDYTKTKTFIAFVNIDGRDKFWVDSNDPCDRISPKIYPYETKEEKETAKLVGHRTAMWSESGDRIEGVLLKVCETIPVINKKEAEELEQKWIKKSKEEREALAEEKHKKKDPEPLQKPLEPVSKPVEKIVEKVVEKSPEPIVEAPKKRGRPRIHPLVDD